MNSIFISYRRDDSISTAKLLKAILESEVGKNTVFLDTTTMEPGEKWRQSLKTAVLQAKVVIALIGPYWKSEAYWKTRNPDDNRLFKDDDWVRLELETALEDKNKKIIPMIFYPDKIDGFDDSILFLKNTLPASLHSLAGEYNKAIIHEKQFEDDLRRTIIAINPYTRSEDELADLPLPDFNPQNPLDRLPKNPFKGLDYFTEQDARIFFGRGEQIRELYYKILNDPLLLFYGQSGVGKSSVLFAGLKRRMERAGWKIQYWRRESTINLAEKLNAYIAESDIDLQLIILDQIEEIYTDPSKILSAENEKFQLIESIENAMKKKKHIILGFREEYLSKVQELFDEKSIEYGKMPLRHMQVKGVLEAIEGITKSELARSRYNLSFEADKDVPQKIAYLVLSDKQSYVAPLLQLLLRKLWDRVAGRDGDKIITEKLFDEVKSQSLNDLLNDQIKLLRAEFSNEIDSGLVLDLLYFFTTSRGTSASHTDEELKACYDYERILDLTDALKNKYLLTGLQSEDIYMTRLAHDALAPLIREMYAQSIFPGQRAAKLLESKRYDIVENPEGVDFSSSDLATIDAGAIGMRRFLEREKIAIELSRKRILQLKLELDQALKEGEEQRTIVKSQVLLAKGKAVLQWDPTLALRIIEASLKITKKPIEQNQSAFVDILSGNPGLYKRVIVHSGPVTIATYSPDGQKIFTATENQATSLAFSPDGKNYVLGDRDGTVKLLDGKGVTIQVFEGHTQAITSIVFSADGKSILSGSRDHTARLWDLNGITKEIFKDENSEVHSVAFSPDGKSILSGSYKVARLWDLNGNTKQLFDGHTTRVRSVAFSPDGKSILTGSEDYTARLYDLNGIVKQVFEGHSQGINSIAFSPDGNSLLTGSNDRTARLWDLNGNTLQIFEGHLKHLTSVAFSPDGKSILTGSEDSTARLWDLNRISKIFEGSPSIAVAFSPNGKSILTGSDDGIARLWDLNGIVKQVFEGHASGINSIAFSPDGESIITGSADKTARLWDLNGITIQIFEGHSKEIKDVAFSPDGESIITGSRDKTARLWNLNGVAIQVFEAHSSFINAVAFSPDAKSILTGSWDKTARLWGLNGIVKQVFEGHSKGINSIAFSPDGESIITGSTDKTARIWDLYGNTRQIFNHSSEIIGSVAFSPDGKLILLASDANTARLCDLNGITKQFFQGPRYVTSPSVAFSPDGKSIVTACGDRTARLWWLYWEILNPVNIYVPTPEQMKEYDIPNEIEWGESW